MMSSPPHFDNAFRSQLEALFLWRRDVRRFQMRSIDPALINDLQRQAEYAPSVGDSKPWRWMSIDAPKERAAMKENFTRCNRAALDSYEGEQALLYARLKLAGLDRAPRQFAIFCDMEPVRGSGLGHQTMPETLCYSVVAHITLFWLAARASGIGVGWLSILDPQEIQTLLRTPPQWRFIAYLCVGYPEEEHLDRELVRHGWVSDDIAGNKRV